jgi:hypothetical protein
MEWRVFSRQSRICHSTSRKKGQLVAARNERFLHRKRIGLGPAGSHDKQVWLSVYAPATSLQQPPPRLFCGHFDLWSVIRFVW